MVTKQATMYLDYFLSKQDEVLNLTRALVEAESPSGDEEGSKAVVSLIADAATSIPGANIERFSAAGYGEHLRITAFSEAQGKPVVLLGHTDTVHPRGSLNERPWRVEGGKAYGPGVFDMKANCALALEVIRACGQAEEKPRRPLVLLLTCDEENGSPSGRALVEEAAQTAHAVLVMEPSASGGSVKTGRKGTGMYTIRAQGRAAHAGLEPEKGASAVLELARQTDRLHSMNNHGNGISINVGVFHGGTLSNVVPAEARADVDVRFSTTEEAQLVERQIRSLKPFDERVSLEVSGGINRPPLERSEKVMELYHKARAIAAQLNFELDETQVGGASDGNFAAAAGAAVLDGLGIAGDGAHTVHEHIIVEDIPRRGALLTQLVSTL